jgi:hypothetical protein
MKHWLSDLLAAELPALTIDARRILAEKIVDALPRDVIAAAICSSAYTQLRVRGHDEKCLSIARDIGGNAAMSVCCVLEPGVELDE